MSPQTQVNAMMHVFNDQGAGNSHIDNTGSTLLLESGGFPLAPQTVDGPSQRLLAAPCRPELCSRRVWLDEVHTEPRWRSTSQRCSWRKGPLATGAEALVVPALAQGFAVPRGPRADLAELRATPLLRLRVLLTPFSSALGAALILVVVLVMLPLYATSSALLSPSGQILGPWSGRLIPSGLYVDPTSRRAAAAPR